MEAMARRASPRAIISKIFGKVQNKDSFTGRQLRRASDGRYLARDDYVVSVLPWPIVVVIVAHDCPDSYTLSAPLSSASPSSCDSSHLPRPFSNRTRSRSPPRLAWSKRPRPPILLLHPRVLSLRVSRIPEISVSSSSLYLPRPSASPHPLHTRTNSLRPAPPAHRRSLAPRLFIHLAV